MRMLREGIGKLFYAPEPLPDVYETQWYSLKEIREYQEARLRKLVQYVYSSIPYYQKLFQSLNLRPKDIQTLDDLKKLPVLTRQEAIANYSAITNPKLENFKHYSGATTGERLAWISSKPWAEIFTATLWRGFSWAGLDPEQRVASFYSRVIGQITQNSLIIREPFDINRFENDLKSIREFDPQIVYCYASSANIMAQHLLKNGLRLPVKAVITTSDQLYSHYKADIEEAFQCKVYNNYGCNDGGAWGAECSQREGFHHDYERSIIEFTENGKMLVTDLWNYAMPLIRYENGDSGRWLNKCCSCKRAMPLFTVEGRINDYIFTPTQQFSPTEIDILLRDNASIGDLQIVQQSKTVIEIFFIPKKGYTAENVKSCLKAFTDKVKGMELIYSEVTQIERPASNKKRLCINKVAGPGRPGYLSAV